MPHSHREHKLHIASKTRQKAILRARAECGAFTSARGMSRLIESLAKTLDDYHYISMRTPTEITVNFIDGRKMKISVQSIYG